MAKGLDAILERIKERASPTLVERYLALLGDLDDEVDKAKRALAVAKVLQTQRSSQALSIAHMVYKSGQEQSAALDIMINILERRGRHRQAEQLRIEKQGLQKPQTNALKRHELSIDEADFTLASDEHEPKLAIALEEEIPLISVKPGRAAAPTLREPVQLSEEAAPAAGGETNENRLLAPLKTSLSRRQSPHAQDFNLHGEQAKLGVAALRAPGVEVPTVPEVALGAAVDLFDHYWAQGFIADARDVLVQTAPVAGHEAWWQARHTLLTNASVLSLNARLHASRPLAANATRSLESDQKSLSQPEAPVFLAVQEQNNEPAPMSDSHTLGANESSPASAPVPQLPLAEPSWKPLYDELLRIAARRRLATASSLRVEQFKSKLSAQALPERFCKVLAAVDAELLTERSRDLLWNLLRTWWQGSLDDNLYGLLKLLGLHRYYPQWFGLFLDCMIATARSSQIPAFVMRCLESDHCVPKLEWARVAMERLPKAMDRQGLRSFQWSEDEGVAALLAKLSVRPRQRLRSLLLDANSELHSAVQQHRNA